MDQQQFHQGDFTLPGEAGYEQLTLEMAKKWGADVIRDSDGTKLSPEIIEAGYQIYSTICIIRQHNAFAQEHPDAQQETFLSSKPIVAETDTLAIHPLESFFAQQFELNDTADGLRFWQVWDRTSNELVPAEKWSYSDGEVTLKGVKPWHEYTVSFLAWRIWEEINMYNHTTNNWTSEHLRQLDPRHPAAWDYLQAWLRNWCEENPDTNVVRLTSLFYNFVWIFDKDVRSMYADWASYDYTVSPAALDAFEKEYGYALTAEDFINQGKLQVTHMPPTAHKRDYMDFIQRFVAEKAKVLVDIIHEYGKKAYVFYDDSWVGMEPSGKYFANVGFDGLIKCVFSGYECRLCADAKVPVHELRFHPYLFPVGLGGLPTFAEGGHPEEVALAYWKHVRRALGRQTVDRIGLGGYLHLTIGQPAFNDAIEQMAVDFRRIKALHKNGSPYTQPCQVAVLHTWGSLRPWTLSGHFHETYMNNLIHINEALSGLPVDVRFVSFADVENGALKDVDVVINAGREGDAWSGGDAWKSDKLVEELTRFVHEGGLFLGVNEPSATEGSSTLFRMAQVLGVDKDRGARVCHSRLPYVPATELPFTVDKDHLPADRDLYLTDEKTVVLADKEGIPTATMHPFGKGCGVYLSGFDVNPVSTRMLLEMFLWAVKEERPLFISDNLNVEVGAFPADRVLIALNNADTKQSASFETDNGAMTIELLPGETRIMNY